jgi:1-deoxy-D-xylulose-5-phosphate synthase
MHSKSRQAKQKGLERLEQRKRPSPYADLDLRVLPRLKGPEHLRQLPTGELPVLAQEIRQVLNAIVALNGGHLSSNLGITELTIALHRVFDFLHDRLVLDVGHQVYVHKLLTGRFERFQTLRQKGGLSGFPAPEESDYDMFRTAHASAAISTGLGLSVGDDLAGTDRHTVAVVGDGAMTGGMSFEGLNHAGHLKARRLIVVLNDNEMAISPTVGALQKYLDRIRMGSLYNTLRDRLRKLVQSIPMVGDSLDFIAERATLALSEFVQPGQIFRELGFRYFGPVDGHNLGQLIETFRDVRQLEGPILVHVVTQKGKGIPYATEDPEKFHSPAGYKIPAGPDEAAATNKSSRGYGDVFMDALIDAAEKDQRICGITAAMPSGTGLARFAECFPERYFDVGICEPHSVAFAAGLSKAGRLPVTCLYSSFLQRAFDQVFHELCLQEDLPALIGVDRGGLVGGDGAPTNGVYDIAFLRTLPNLVHLSPKDGPELRAMAEWALQSGRIVALRYPREEARDLGLGAAPIELGRGEMLREGEDVAILGYGPHVRRCLQAAEVLSEEHGLYATVVNARFAKPVDEELVHRLLRTHRLVVTVEDHALMGGFGSAVLEAASARGSRVQRLRRIGIPDRFISHGSREDCLRDVGLDVEGIVKQIGAWRESKRRRR